MHGQYGKKDGQGKAYTSHNQTSDPASSPGTATVAVVVTVPCCVLQKLPAGRAKILRENHVSSLVLSGCSHKYQVPSVDAVFLSRTAGQLSPTSASRLPETVMVQS